MATKEDNPTCQLCKETVMTFIGIINQTAIHICEKCDRVYPKRKG